MYSREKLARIKMGLGNERSKLLEQFLGLSQSQSDPDWRELEYKEIPEFVLLQAKGPLTS